MTDEMTTGEADAWRAGWRAAVEAAASFGDAFAHDLNDWGEPDGRDWVREFVVNIRAMQPPKRPSKGETP